MLEKEGNGKTKETCLTNLAEYNLMQLSPHETKKVNVVRKASQALWTCSANYFKAVTRASLTHDNYLATEDVALCKKTFWSGISELKSKNERSMNFPAKS